MPVWVRIILVKNWEIKVFSKGDVCGVWIGVEILLYLCLKARRRGIVAVVIPHG